MKRLIRVKCDQNLLRCDSKNCSFSSKYIAMRLVSLLEQEIVPLGAESSVLGGDSLSVRDQSRRFGRELLVLRLGGQCVVDLGVVDHLAEQL